jgi:hypothetical protein
LPALAAACEAVVICVSADADLRAVIGALEPGLSAGIDRHRLLHGRRGHRARYAPRLAPAASASSIVR